MEFRNLTPLHAIAFKAVDVPGDEFHVVALKAGYKLVKRATAGPNDLTHDCVLLEGPRAAPLVMADEYEAAVGKSSVKYESDLAPFKPACDVLIRATAHAPGGAAARSWPAYARLWDHDDLVLDKTITLHGPRHFRKNGEDWNLSSTEPARSVPVRWEHAYGGASEVRAVPDSGQPILNEVCFSNPLGCGWIEKRYFDSALDADNIASSHMLAAIARHEHLDQFPAPQIELEGKPVTTLDITGHPSGELDARKMAEIAAAYQFMPTGLGVTGRAWSPRLQHAGTYDEAWLKKIWPYLPKDFDFRYWNGAPADQQISWPSSDLTLDLMNLAAPEHTFSGRLSARLRGHRAVFALRYASGAILPAATHLDTVVIDTEEMQVMLTWRAVFPQAPRVRVCEARFETDPEAPMLKFKQDDSAKIQEAVWQTT